MFQSKYFVVLVLCQILSLCVTIHGGGSRRAINKYSFERGFPYQNTGYEDQTNSFSSRFGIEETAKVLGLTKVILSPVIIPAILFVGIMLLLFFAVVGSSAVVGGALGRGKIPYRHYFARQLSSTAKLASDVLGSEECVEKLACEIFRKAKGHQAENWIVRTLNSLGSLPIKPNWMGRISRSMKSASECQEFFCPSVSRIGKALKILNIASS